MNRKTLLFSIALMGVVVAGGAYLWAHRPSRVVVNRLERHMTLDELAQESDLIGVGTLQTKTIRIVDDTTADQLVYTDWTVIMSDVWKGTRPDPLVLSLLGGEKNGIRVDVTGQNTSLTTGQEYLMFLEYLPESNMWTVSPRQDLFRRDGSAYRNAAGDSYALAVMRDAVRRHDLAVPALQQLVSEAELIVYGKLAGEQTKVEVDENGKKPSTYWQIQPSTVWKGAILTEPITLRIEGGQEPGGGWTPSASGISLQNGMSLLLFLRRDAAHNAWVPVIIDRALFLQYDQRYYDSHGVSYAESALRAVFPQAGQ